MILKDLERRAGVELVELRPGAKAAELKVSRAAGVTVYTDCPLPWVRWAQRRALGSGWRAALRR